MKSCEFTIEEIDRQHPWVQSLTGFVMHASVILGMLITLWYSRVGDEYFKGASTCPALSVGRQLLARFDANVFYYYKSSLSIYCDIEDSFWRLLMDGWVRGIVAGSDSCLLLISTLPKAWLFKSVVSTFLLPVYAMLTAVCGMVLSWLIVRLEDSAQGMIAASPLVSLVSPGGGRPKIQRAASKVFKFPSQLKQKITTKTSVVEKLQRLLLALGISGLLRLFMYAIGFQRIAALGAPEVNMWQLAFQPLILIYLARLCTSLNSTLTKTVWKKGPPSTAAPLTLWRARPAKDYMESLSYARNRAFRSYTVYREQAAQILHVLVEDVFNFVIFARALIIVFDLAPLLRALFTAVGFGSVVNNHKDWFFQATGFQEESIANKYVTDRLLNFGFSEMFAGFGVISNVVVQDDRFAIQQVTWRLLLPVLFYLLVPLVLYLLQAKWNTLIKQQQTDFKKAWKGTDWKSGGYADMLDKFGSYWKEVPKSEWSMDD